MLLPIAVYTVVVVGVIVVVVDKLTCELCLDIQGANQADLWWIDCAKPLNNSGWLLMVLLLIILLLIAGPKV